jgi:endonuclease/exonuclease/phosphatase family metal-dependent hydrolase
MALLSFFYCCSGSLFAQIIMPAKQTLPFKQKFDTWPNDATADATAFLPGFQGWVAGGNASGPTQYITDATPTANATIIAGKDAANTAGSFYNYGGKIGFLNTGGLNLTLGFAFSSIGQTDIKVQYDAITIRNPYDVPPKTANTRINEMVLQYRIGDTAPFISLLDTAYRNNTDNQIIGTADQNLKTITVVLPAACENQSLVQIRWISKQESGGGSRPSFAIDNIIIGSDVTAPISALGYPKAENVYGESFDFSNKLDEIAKTYFVLLPGGSAQPTIAQLKAGQDATGTAALQSGILDITNPAQAVVKNFAGLSLGTSYSVFSISEDSYGNVQSVINKVDITTASVPTPLISTTVTSLDLGFSQSNFDEVLSYKIQAVNLTSDVVLASTGNFTISKDNSTFGSSLTFAAADLASNATPTVYVKFTPNAISSFSGQITHTTAGGPTKTVILTGVGINAYKQGFNDINVLTNSGWTQYDVAGTLNKWASTTVTRNVNSGTGAVLINGFTETGASKDWLISPKLHLDTFGQFPLLSFYSRKFYGGPALKLMASVDYDGKSNPETATWTEIPADFPTVTGTYAKSQYIKLNNFKTSHTYLAWVYETTAGGSNFAAEWSLDDIEITDEAGYVASNPVIDFGDVNPNDVSASQSFVFKAEGYGDIAVTAPASYELSLDNITFQNSVVVSSANAVTGKTVYARFIPTVRALSISGTLTVTGTSLNKQTGSFTGSSLPKVDTFDVVTYNLEFFGTNVKGSDGVEFGPTDNDLQVENVAKVMNKLNADVYVVQEVSDEPNLNKLIQKISINGKTFDKSISTSWSYSFNAPQANFPPQKLVVLYNTQTTSVKSTRVMFKKLNDEIQFSGRTLPNYPDDSKSFFASGRLPYMVKIETNIGGITKEINLIDIHARANSGTDISKYNMRKYDAQMLKDSLDLYYPNSNLIILGDFNDDVKASVITPNPSSYKSFVDDVTNYNALTLGISQAGAYSYLSSTGFLDHIIISNELSDQYIPNSIAVYDPRNDIANYTSTTSDHGPVIARFDLKAANLSTIDFENKNGFYVQAFPNPTTDVVNVVVKSAKNDKNLKLKFYDITGHLVGNPVEINATQDLSTTAIPVGYLQTGIYVYTLSENNKVVYKGKIIKK